MNVALWVLQIFFAVFFLGHALVHYFPPAAIRKEYFRPSDTHTECGWKGTASYYTLDVNGKQNPDAAWYYPDPKPAAKNIAGYVAFWKGVSVS